MPKNREANIICSVQIFLCDRSLKSALEGHLTVRGPCFEECGKEVCYQRIAINVDLRGPFRLENLANGINKLHIVCIVEADMTSIDELQNVKIIEDPIQSTGIAVFSNWPKITCLRNEFVHFTLRKCASLLAHVFDTLVLPRRKQLVPFGECLALHLPSPNILCTCQDNRYQHIYSYIFIFPNKMFPEKQVKRWSSHVQQKPLNADSKVYPLFYG